MLFLTVPYAEKDEAKALGARWNPTKRRWYVPDGVAVDAFAKWAGQGADSGPASGAPGAGKTAAGGRVDSYQGKTVVGANYVALEHDCNPFEPCAQCSAALAGTAWLKARQHLAGLVPSL
ncbi:MAG: DUF5710 domain-containing protein [Telluria sp.]